jgi:hypothetical protein
MKSLCSTIKTKCSLLVAAILITFPIGCQNSTDQINVQSDFVLKDYELTGYLAQLGVRGWQGNFTADQRYALPSKDWIEYQYSSSLHAMLSSLRNGVWIAEDNDCDDFARAAAFLAQYLHHNTIRKQSNTGLAFGEFWYIKQPGGEGHAINIFVYRNKKGEISVGFYEPQDQQIIKLTKKEIDSCIYYRF